MPRIEPDYRLGRLLFSPVPTLDNVLVQNKRTQGRYLFEGMIGGVVCLRPVYQEIFIPVELFTSEDWGIINV